MDVRTPPAGAVRPDVELGDGVTVGPQLKAHRRAQINDIR